MTIFAIYLLIGMIIYAFNIQNAVASMRYMSRFRATVHMIVMWLTWPLILTGQYRGD
jgi:multisubunit Na+/H+ antiporter MnhG subunit